MVSERRDAANGRKSARARARPWERRRGHAIVARMPRLRPPALLALTLVLAACPEPGKGDSTGGSTDASTTGGSTGGATGGSTGGATEPTTGGPPTAECQQDSDCTIVNNCCECSTRPVDAEIPACEGNCRQSTCDALQLVGVAAACRSGVCEFANVQCSEGPPACDAVKPSCPPDTRTSIVDGCWGPCVPARYCEGLGCTGTSCGDGWTCVEHQATGSACAPIPRECGGTPTCACVGPYLDEFCAGGCADAGGGLLCQDGG